MDYIEVCPGVAGGGLNKAREMVRTIQIKCANQTFDHFHQTTAKGKFCAVCRCNVLCINDGYNCYCSRNFFFYRCLYFEHQFVLFCVF